MKVFVTKYALSNGIEEVEVVETCVPGLLQNVNHSHLHYHTEGKDWHRTMEAAVKKADAMRAKKIASLKKQIAKLENTEF